MGHLRIKEKSTADWLLDTQIYPSGYILKDSTTGLFKFSDGVTQYSGLPISSGGSSDLGTFNPLAIDVSTSGSYDPYTVTGNVVLQFTGTPVEGTWQLVETNGWNGSYTIAVPNNTRIINSSFTQGGEVATGEYDLYLSYVGGKYRVNLASAADNTVAAPTLSSYAISGANPDRITFSSSEIITGTTFSGFTLGSGKTITGLTINAGQTTGHYFTVSSAYVEGDGNDTIAYSGSGSDIQNAFGTALASFTATTVTNNVDSTAPIFSNVSVDTLAETTANFNAQIDEAGTIYWAVYPTATSQQTKAAIAAGTGAIDFGNIVTAGSTIETDGITGLTGSTAYKVHYYASDGVNESVATLTSEFTTASATTQLTSLTLGIPEISSGSITIPFTNPNSSNEDQNQLYYKLSTEPTTWTTGVTAVTGATTFPAQTGLTNGLKYDFKAVAEGSGSYSDSNDSNQIEAAPLSVTTSIYLDAKIIDTGDTTYYDNGLKLWTDQSGNDRDASQATETNRPIVTQTTYAGVANVPIMTFATANDKYLDLGAINSLWQSDFELHFFFNSIADGQPAATRNLFGSVEAGDNRIYASLLSDGRFQFTIGNATDGRVKAELNPGNVLPDGAIGETHIRIRVDATTTNQIDLIFSYGTFNSTPETLSVTDDGDLTAFTMSNMSLANNPMLGTYNNAGTPATSFNFDATLKAFYVTPLLNATQAEALYDHVRTLDV